MAKDAEISVVFCDIRDFSRISERLGSTAMVLKWINDVMGALSECVLRHHGVLVDYIGDGLMAMWGAPRAAEPRLSRRLCRRGHASLPARTQRAVGAGRSRSQ